MVLSGKGVGGGQLCALLVGDWLSSVKCLYGRVWWLAVMCLSVRVFVVAVMCL
jgi:hypothetical protein